MATYLNLYFSVCPRSPLETVRVLHKQGGGSSEIEIQYDPSTKIEYLMCDLCSKLYQVGKARSVIKLVEHRGTESCIKEKIKFDQALRPKKSPEILSDCQYHYSSLQYSSACTSLDSSPCSNVPLRCTLCDKSFWKYNFLHHMIKEHILDETEATLPPIPTELRLSTHISRLEEDRMGIAAELTKHYHETWAVPNSDGPQPREATDARSEASEVHHRGDTWPILVASGNTLVPASGIMDPESQKRAYSMAAISVATSNSSYRVPPRPKIIKR